MTARKSSARKKSAAPATPQPATIDEVNQAFNETITKLITTKHVPHVLLLGVLRGITLNLETEYLAAQAAGRGQ